MEIGAGVARIAILELAQTGERACAASTSRGVAGVG